MLNKSNHLPLNRQTDLPMSEKKEENGVFIPKNVIFDKRLSPKAKGLLCMILGQSNDWIISIQGLIQLSNNIGKKAIQSGLKELTQIGYLKLGCFYDEFGKFKGKKYQLVKEVIYLHGQHPFVSVLKRYRPPHQQPHFRTDTKQDEYKKALSGKLGHNSLKINGRPHFEPDNPKMGSTRSVVVDFMNNKDQQQQQIKDDPKKALSECKTGSSATDFYPTLLQDAIWKTTFTGQLLSNQTILTASQFDILLQHFRQTSLRSGVVYDDLAAVKKHFSNWFNSNLSQKALSTYIEQRQQGQQTARKTVFDLVKHSENIFSNSKNGVTPQKVRC